MVSPMPTPKTNMYRASTHPFVDASIIDSRNAPTVIIAVPSIGKDLVPAPPRDQTGGDPPKHTSIPSMTGRIRSPDAVGLTPFTFCMNSGRKVKCPEHGQPHHEADGARCGEHRGPGQLERDDRLLRASLHHDETHRQDDPEHHR